RRPGAALPARFHQEVQALWPLRTRRGTHRRLPPRRGRPRCRHLCPARDHALAAECAAEIQAERTEMRLQENAAHLPFTWFPDCGSVASTSTARRSLVAAALRNG